jgi:hypothetical protein
MEAIREGAEAGAQEVESSHYISDFCKRSFTSLKSFPRSTDFDLPSRLLRVEVIGKWLPNYDKQLTGWDPDGDGRKWL